MAGVRGIALQTRTLPSLRSKLGKATRRQRLLVKQSLTPSPHRWAVTAALHLCLRYRDRAIGFAPHQSDDPAFRLYDFAYKRIWEANGKYAGEVTLKTGDGHVIPSYWRARFKFPISLQDLMTVPGNGTAVIATQRRRYVYFSDPAEQEIPVDKFFRWNFTATSRAPNQNPDPTDFAIYAFETPGQDSGAPDDDTDYSLLVRPNAAMLGQSQNTSAAPQVTAAPEEDTSVSARSAIVPKFLMGTFAVVVVGWLTAGFVRKMVMRDRTETHSAKGSPKAASSA